MLSGLQSFEKNMHIIRSSVCELLRLNDTLVAHIMLSSRAHNDALFRCFGASLIFSTEPCIVKPSSPCAALTPRASQQAVDPPRIYPEDKRRDSRSFHS